MKCIYCGAEIPDNSAYCNACGKAVPKEGEQIAKKGVYFSPGSEQQAPIITKTATVHRPAAEAFKENAQKAVDNIAKEVSQKSKEHKENRKKKQINTALSQQKHDNSNAMNSNNNHPQKVNGLARKRITNFNYRKAYKGFNNYTEKKTTFIFASPYNLAGTVNLIADVLSRFGKLKEKDERRGYVAGKIYYSRFTTAKVEFYISQKDSCCAVRAILGTSNYIKMKDAYWDVFLDGLFTLAPGADFGVSLCNGKPYLIAVKYLGSDVVITTHSTTTNGTSLLGLLLGEAAFGTAGGIVEGMSGNRYTNSVSSEAFADRQLARVVYNNGRVYEGVVKKNSRLYNEIMVNI